MKTLTLLRHAKSSWDDPVARDIDRPLNARGRRAARAVGQEMRAKSLRFDAVLASPAVRVIETLEDVGEAYGAELHPRFEQQLYLASAEALLDVVRRTGDDVERLLLVGHNPGLERLVLLLTAADNAPLRDMVEEKYPTGALVEISLPIDRWRDLREESGTVVRFIRPRDLDPALGPDER